MNLLDKGPHGRALKYTLSHALRLRWFMAALLAAA